MQTDLTVSPAKAFPDNFMDGLVMLYLEQQDLFPDKKCQP